MLDAFLYTALGFAIAGLLALAMLPAVSGRAMRLARKSLEAKLPMSINELGAARDQARAAAAIEIVRAERLAESERDKRHLALADAGRLHEKLRRQTAEVASAQAHIASVEAEAMALRQLVAETKANLAASEEALKTAKKSLKSSEKEIAALQRDLSDRAASLDAMRVEAVALSTRIAALEDGIASRTQQASLAAQALSEREAELADARSRYEEGKALSAAADLRAAALDSDITTLKMQIQRMESDSATRDASRVEIERRLATVTEELRKRDQQLAERGTKVALAAGREAELLNEIARLQKDAQRTAVDLTKGADALRSDRASLEAELDKAKAERAQLLRQIADLKLEARENWGVVETDNQILRVEMARLATEIARLATPTGTADDGNLGVFVTGDGPSLPRRARTVDERAEATQV